MLAHTQTYTHTRHPQSLSLIAGTHTHTHRDTHTHKHTHIHTHIQSTLSTFKHFRQNPLTLSRRHSPPHPTPAHPGTSLAQLCHGAATCGPEQGQQSHAHW